jgi:hypothetical protein
MAAARAFSFSVWEALASLLADDAALTITRVLLSGVGVADTLVPLADTVCRVRTGWGNGYSVRIAQKFDFDKSEFVGGWWVDIHEAYIRAIGVIATKHR